MSKMSLQLFILGKCDKILVKQKCSFYNQNNNNDCIPLNPMPKIYEFTVTPEYIGCRLDKFLLKQLNMLLDIPLSRTQLQKYLEQGCCRLQDILLNSADYRVKADDNICFQLPESSSQDPAAKLLPLNIVYEDEDLLVIDKPAGLIVHPGNQQHQSTLVNALLAYCPDTLSDINGAERPGIVHRLDKDTSGLMVVAKNNVSHRYLAQQLANHEMEKIYTAICWKYPVPVRGMVEANLDRDPVNRLKMRVVQQGGKPAITHYRVEDIFLRGKFSQVQCQLATGRTHQIRVHMAHKGCPLVGDPQYCRTKNTQLQYLPSELSEKLAKFQRQALHSTQLTFLQPLTHKLLQFQSEPPEDMQQLLALLKEYSSED